MIYCQVINLHIKTKKSLKKIIYQIIYSYFLIMHWSRYSQKWAESIAIELLKYFTGIPALRAIQSECFRPSYAHSIHSLEKIFQFT